MDLDRLALPTHPIAFRREGRPWDEERIVDRRESLELVAEAFSERLKRVALRTPRATVLASAGAMKKRARQIWEANGKDIARD